MSTDACRVFFQTPELIECLTLHLSRREQLQLMRVDRTLHAVVQAYFWSSCLDFLPHQGQNDDRELPPGVASPFMSLQSLTFSSGNAHEYYFLDDHRLFHDQQRQFMPDRVFVNSLEAMAALARNVERVFLLKSRNVFQDAYFDSLTSYLEQWLAMDSFAPVSIADDGSYFKTNDTEKRSAFENLLRRRPRLNRPEVDVQPLAPLARLRRFECAIQRESLPPETASTSLKVLWVLQCHLQASILQANTPVTTTTFPNNRYQQACPRPLTAKSQVSTMLTHLTLHGLDLENASVVRVLAQTLPHLDCLRQFEINTFNNGPVPLQACRVIFFACPSKSLESIIMRFSIDSQAPLMDLTVNKTRYSDGGGEDINMKNGFVEPQGHFLDPNRLARDSRAFGDLDWELDSFWDRPVSARIVPLLRLKLLQLPSMDFGYPGDLLRTILKQCPALESLNVPRTEASDDVEMMSQAVQDYCPRLRNLAVLESRVELNQELIALMNQISEGRAQILSRHLPRRRQSAMELLHSQAQSQERESMDDDYTVQSLQFQNFRDRDGGLMRAIERHAKLCASTTTFPSSFASPHPPPFLTVIRFTQCRGVRSATLQAILSLCSGLEHLEVDGISPGGCAIGLGDAVVVRWVCSKVRVLKLNVDPHQTRPTPAGNANGGGGTTLSAETMALSDNNDLGPGCASASALERLCRKIGRLTELRVLDLRIASGSAAMENGGRALWQDYRDLNFPGWLKLDSADELGSLPEPLEHASNEGQGQGWSTSVSFGPKTLNKEKTNTQSSGYLSALAGLTQLRELRGSFRQDRSLRKDRMGKAEFEWISRYWPNLEVIELISRRAEDHLIEACYDPSGVCLTNGGLSASQPRFPRPPRFGLENVPPAIIPQVLRLQRRRLQQNVEFSGYDGDFSYVRSIAPLLRSLNDRMPRLRASVPHPSR